MSHFPFVIFLFFLTSIGDLQASGSNSLTDSLSEGDFDRAVELSVASEHYLNELLDEARRTKLHTHPVWRTLIHYKSSILFGDESLVDSPSFFLSQDGKFSPEAELAATLASFFSDAAISPTDYSGQCRFPARYRWLKSQLSFDLNRLNENPCEILKQYYDAIDPQGITVIFPSTHPNSPSSMFGHTLLRIDKKNQTDETRMLAFSISYAAVIPQEQGMLSYTILGLSGGFPGSFNVLPYYIKLREYGQIENRDVWEYRLNIPPEDVDMILFHAFELVYAYFDYYFFTENCSYHLLSLLDVLYADDPLTNDYDNGWTIPVDTVKTLEARGLIEEVSFYPSQARVIDEQRKVLSNEERLLALNIYEKGIGPMVDELSDRTDQSRIKILDLATEYLRFAKVRDSEVTVSSKLTQEEKLVLLQRSKIRQKSVKLDISPPGERPDFGHNTSRLGLARGVMLSTDNDVAYSDLRWRAAYHDLLDPSQGFVSNSSLSFMDIGLRKYDDSGSVKLQNITILDIQSLEPRDEFFTNTSWRANVSWIRDDKNYEQGNDWYFSAEGGSGYSYLLSQGKADAWYGFLDAGVRYHRASIGDSQTLWGGFSSGFILEPLNGWRLQLSADYKSRMLGRGIKEGGVTLGQGISLSRNSSVRITTQRLYRDREYRSSIEIGLYVYL